MERLIILVGRVYKYVAVTKYFFKVPLVGRCMPLIGVVRRPVESPLDPMDTYPMDTYPLGHIPPGQIPLEQIRLAHTFEAEINKLLFTLL